MAIIGKILELNKKSDKAKDITNGVVTCDLNGKWFNSEKMVTVLNNMPKIDKNVAELPANIESKVVNLKVSFVSQFGKFCSDMLAIF